MNYTLDHKSEYNLSSELHGPKIYPSFIIGKAVSLLVESFTQTQLPRELHGVIDCAWSHTSGDEASKCNNTITHGCENATPNTYQRNRVLAASQIKYFLSSEPVMSIWRKEV